MVGSSNCDPALPRLTADPALSRESPSDPAAAAWELADPDVRLMLEVRQGSAAAFEQLVRRYQRRIISFLSQLAPPEMAEDLAQEVFMRVYRAREGYRPGARFSTWLFTIAHNVASNAKRRQSRRRELQAAQNPADSQQVWSVDQMAQAPSGQLPARRLDRLELSEVVGLAMQTLNERQRTAVFLSKFESMGYQEIADTMQLTTKAVKSLLSRARANLRDVLQPYLETGHWPEQVGLNRSPSGTEDDGEEEADADDPDQEDSGEST